MNPADLTFDHLGIVVGDLEAAHSRCQGLLGPLARSRRFDDPELGVSVAFVRDTHGLVYELIAPLGTASPVSRALRAQVNILNHVAYRTTSLEATTRRLRKERAIAIGNPKRALAFGGARIQFLQTDLGFLIELIEADRIVHEFRD